MLEAVHDLHVELGIEYVLIVVHRLDGVFRLEQRLLRQLVWRFSVFLLRQTLIMLQKYSIKIKLISVY